MYNWKLYLLATVMIMTVNAKAQKVKIGYVDRAKVLTELSTWKDIDQKLLIMKEDAEFELQGLLTEADSLTNVLQNQIMLTESMKNQVQGRIEQLSRDYQRIGVARQQELLIKENEFKGPILKGFDEVVRQLGIDEDYTLIYDRTINAILFAAGGRDLTEQILFEMRKKYK